MVHHPHARRRGRLPTWVAVLAVLLLPPGAARAQQVLRESFAQVGGSQAVQLTADRIATWTEGSQRVFLLRGKAVVTQGEIAVRMAHGVVWIDESQHAKTGTYVLEVYGEGPIGLEYRTQAQADFGYVQLATRGEINIKSFASKVVQQDLTADPTYQRARGNRAVVAAAVEPRPAPTIVQAQATNPAPQVVQAVAQQVPPQAPPGTPERRTVPVPPGPDGVQVPTPATAPGKLDEAPAPRPLEGPPPAEGPPKQLTIRPRSGQELQSKIVPMPNGETAVVITSGVILNVTAPGSQGGLLDIEADRLCVWTRGNAQDLFGNLKSPQGQTSRSLEFYLSGNVEIRSQTEKEAITQRAAEVYYDVGRNVAIAIKSDLEIKEPKIPFPIHLRSEELFQLNATTFQAKESAVYSTILPSDPGLRVVVKEVTIEERAPQPRGLLGLFRQEPVAQVQGQPPPEKERYFNGENFTVNLEGVPIFYFPYFRGRVTDPLGPLEAISFNANRIFGFQTYITWDMFDLLGLQRPEGDRWRLYTDYLSDRGPALGTEYDFSGRNFFGAPANYDGLVKLYGISDRGRDILGGDRGDFIYLGPGQMVPVDHPELRGRALAKVNVQELPNGFTFQSQVSAVSDRNFLEQFYLPEWLNDLDQHTYAYLKQQNNNWAWTLYGQTRLRSWITETEWLPRADGFLLGESLLGDRVTYNAHASAGFARLRPADLPPPTFPYQPNDVRLDVGRVDLIQEASLPFYLGAVKTVPYVVGDVAGYSEDIYGDARGRLYGGAGVRTSLPLSRLYPGVQSELFNLNGIFHKIELNSNYYYARTNVSMLDLPQLDRLNDDATDRTLRDIRPYLPTINPGNAVNLTSSLLYNPQVYALRRLVDSRVDTLDDINVLQLDLRQRWQTKRGFPGNQHVVDWMTLDLRGSVFPGGSRFDFGKSVGILEYDYLWNVGDRTAFFANGWLEPFENGPRVFNVGTILNRPDNTTFTLAYRQYDPLESRAVFGSVSYAFSAKYALTASTAWDFGIDQQDYSIMLSRIGTDLQVSFGVTYNSILNNFNIAFEIVPSLLRGQIRSSGPFALTGPGNMVNSNGR